MKKLLIATATLLLMTASAHAATTTFDFTDGNKSQTTGTLNYSADGIDLSVSSARYYDPAGAHPLGVYDYGDIGQSNGNGLYIQWGMFEDHQIDGNGKDEVAVFQFSQNVTLESISFNYYQNDSNGADAFAFFFDSDDDGKLELVNGNLDANSSDTYMFLNAFLKTGNMFGIGAIDGAHDFKIASLTVSNLSVVPLPAGLPLYGAGLVILGFIGWRRKRKKMALAA